MTLHLARGWLRKEKVLGWHVLGVVLAASLFLALATAASAHFKVHGDWVFSGHTHTSDDPRIDPLNVWLMAHSSGLQVDGVFMFDRWSGMDELGFRPRCASNQSIYDKHPRHNDQNDAQLVTGCYEDKWHVRLWDAVEHDQDYPGHHSGDNVRQFEIAGVHHDDCCPDSIHMRWERAEIRAMKELWQFCSWRNDLRLPGSKGRFQDYYSNGKVTRISPVGVAHPGPCH